MNDSNSNAIEDLKEIAVQRLKKIDSATNDATRLQQHKKKNATNVTIIEDQKLIDWFFENYEKLPKNEFNITETRNGKETWHQPQKVYDFIIKNIVCILKGPDYKSALIDIRKLKQKFSNKEMS